MKKLFFLILFLPLCLRAGITSSGTEYKGYLKAAGTLTVTSPKAGDSWPAGKFLDINWDSQNVDNVSISYSSDNGATWNLVTSSTPASYGSYIWTVPTDVSSQYKIRIADAVNDSVNALSGIFSVYIAPTASTEAATDITLNSATLNGIVNAGNGSTTVSFEYGLTSTYDSAVAAVQSPLNGETSTNVNAALSGLLPGTTYHYRVKAENGAGVTYGSDMIFSTDKADLTLISPSGGEVWQSGRNYDITWTSKNVKSIRISYSTDDGVNWSLIESGVSADPGSYSWKVPDYVSSSYRVRISDASNSQLSSESNSFAVYSLPVAVTDAASNVGAYSAVLNGTVSAGNSQTSVSFEYGTTNSYGSGLIDASPNSVSGMSQTSVSASISGLQQGVTYHYRVMAVNSAGTVYGNDRTFTTDAASVTLTSPSGGERWRSGSTHSIVWTSRNVTDLILEYSADSGQTWSSINNGNPVSASGGTYSWRVPDGLPTEYTIRISDALHSAISSVSGSFSVYSQPEALTNPASDITANSVILNGSVNPNNSLTTVTFEYGTTASYGSTLTAQQSPLSGTTRQEVSIPAAGLQPATTYHFRLKAQNEAGIVYGDDMTFRLDSINLALSSPKAGDEWLAGSDQNITWQSRNVNTLIILYSLDGGNSWITITENAPAQTGSYSWKAPDSLSSLYRIRIIDAQNVSIRSTSGAFSVYSFPSALTTAPSNISFNSAVIRGIASAGNSSAAVTFEYGTSTLYGQTVPSQQDPVSGTKQVNVSAELTGLLPATTYHYRTSARNAAGTVFGGDVTFTTDSIKISLTSPAGGEMWKAGSAQDITWSFKNLDSLKIEYSTSDSSGWTTLASSVAANSGKYQWTVPNTLSSTYRVRISSSTDSLFSYTSKAFSVYSAPSAITSDPNNISLNSAVLYASINPGNSTATVTFEYGTSTSYGLSVPGVPPVINGVKPVDVTASISGLSQGNTYHFRIMAENQAGKVYGDDKTFTTDGITLTLTSPSGSEYWQAGSQKSISWRSKNVAGINISYSSDNGQTWTAIAAAVPTSQRSYTWTVPGQASSKYKVRITDVSNTQLNATSNAFIVYSMPSAQTKQAVDVSLTSVTLRGTVNAGNSATQAFFEYGPTASYGAVAAVSQNPISGTTDTDVSARISGLNQGAIYHYRLRAINTAGNAYGDDNTFTLLSPQLKLTSPSGGEELTGSVQYTITWTSSNVSSINIEYSTDNGNSWLGVASSIDASMGTYTWTVPNNISSASCLIRITDRNSPVTDIIDNVFKISTYSQSISMSGKIIAFSSLKQSAYRMIGLPGESSQLKLSEYAQGEVKKDWTMYYDNGNSTDYYVEYDGSQSFNFAPGKGFWVISRNAINLSGDVKTVALSSDGTYSINLDHGGWNIISSPFDIAVQWSAVQSMNSISENISSWNGSNFIASAVMNPYEGYYFYNSKDLKTLKLPYRAAALKAGKETVQLSKKLSLENSVILSLLDERGVISSITAGINKNSLDDYDPLDAMAPPGDFEAAGLRIIDNNLTTAWKELFTEYRTAVGQGQKFTIRIKNSTERNLKLKWDGADRFNGSEVYLLDKRLSKLHDLKKETDLTLPPNAKLTEFELLIGSSAFIEEENRRLMPQEFSLFQNYPNPFNPATQIKYSLPENAFVTIRVYDVLGRLVKDMVSGFNEAGYHEVSFDGSAISSGVYYYSMEVKATDGSLRFREAKKMLLIK
ncbi:MAG TPA: Ser-Thr-rich GPI-anchored membrane family protein [Ignavibacteriales bacterium]|nr:Ser-Thr-rich GPI-anchored membrane family protein [Ignavibacteriales bacterium]